MISLRGFTLLETLIAIGISALIFAALATLFLKFSSSYNATSAQIDVLSSATYIVNESRDAALQAQSIVASHPFSGTALTTSSTTLILQLPAAASSGDIIANTYDYLALVATTTSVYLYTDADASSLRHTGRRTLTTALNNLTLTYNAGTPTLANHVTLDVTTLKTVKNQTITTHVIRELYLRNQ